MSVLDLAIYRGEFSSGFIYCDRRKIAFPLPYLLFERLLFAMVLGVVLPIQVHSSDIRTLCEIKPIVPGAIRISVYARVEININITKIKPFEKREDKAKKYVRRRKYRHIWRCGLD